MSSLFSIMSLFTEDVQLRLPADETPTPDATTGNQRFSPNVDLHPTRHATEGFPSTPLSENGATKRTVLVQEPDGINPGSPNSSANYRIPHMSLDETTMPKHPRRPGPRRERAAEGIRARHNVSIATHAGDLGDAGAREALAAAHPESLPTVGNFRDASGIRAQHDGAAAGACQRVGLHDPHPGRAAYPKGSARDFPACR